jgi:hypothetical protein
VRRSIAVCALALAPSTARSDAPEGIFEWEMCRDADWIVVGTVSASTHFEKPSTYAAFAQLVLVTVSVEAIVHGEPPATLPVVSSPRVGKHGRTRPEVPSEEGVRVLLFLDAPAATWPAAPDWLPASVDVEAYRLATAIRVLHVQQLPEKAELPPEAMLRAEWDEHCGDVCPMMPDTQTAPYFLKNLPGTWRDWCEHYD